jgi:hypothetical protein
LFVRLRVRLFLLDLWRELSLSGVCLWRYGWLVGGVPDDVIKCNGLLVYVFLLLGASRLPILLHQSLYFLHTIILLTLYPLLIDSFPHPADEAFPEGGHFPLFGVFHDVGPLVEIFHGEEDGLPDEFVVLGGLGGEEVEELLDGVFGVVLVVGEDVAH